MPTTLSWTYKGEHQIEEDGDVQRCRAGELGIDDVLGEVTIVTLDGGDLIVETGEKDADGKPVQTPRTYGHIRAKINLPEPAARPVGTARPGQPKGGLLQLLGAAGASASPTPQAPKKQGKAAKGLGRGAAGGKSPAAAAPAAAKSPAAAAAPKRKEPETPAVDADSDEEFDFGDNVHTEPDSLRLLGAEYADTSDEADGEPEPKRAQGGAVSVRKMDSSKKSAYSKTKYELRKTKLQVSPPLTTHVASRTDHALDAVCIADRDGGQVQGLAQA